MGKHVSQKIKYHYIMRILSGEKIIDIAEEIISKNLSKSTRVSRVVTLLENWILRSDESYYTNRELKSLSPEKKRRRGLNYDELSEEEKKYIIENLDKIIGNDKAINIYRKIEEDRKALPLSKLCKIYGIGRSTFYEWNEKFNNWPEELNEVGLSKELVKIVENKFKEELGMMGYQRMTRELNKTGIDVTEHKVRRIFEYKGLVANWIPTKRRVSESKTDAHVVDLINGKFKVPKLATVYSTDVSHIKLKGNRVCKLSIVIDTCNNEFLDFKVSYNQGSKLTDPNIRDAVLKYNTSPDLIIQSDHGSEYISHSYAKLSRELKFRRSMSPKGESVMNRPSEFLFRIIKTAYFNNPYTGFKKVYEMNLEEFVEFMTWIKYHYNNKRRQPCLGDRAPIEVRNDLAK